MLEKVTPDKKKNLEENPSPGLLQEIYKWFVREPNTTTVPDAYIDKYICRTSIPESRLACNPSRFSQIGRYFTEFVPHVHVPQSDIWKRSVFYILKQLPTTCRKWLTWLWCTGAPAYGYHSNRVFKPRTASAMAVFMHATIHINAGPIPDILCKCDVSLRQKEILGSLWCSSQSSKKEKKQTSDTACVHECVCFTNRIV